MKLQLFLISAFLATVSYAGYSGSVEQGYVNSGYIQNSIHNQYVPVIHNGVPVETPEVQAAKAAHFEAYAKASILAAKQPSDGQYREQEYHQRGYQQQGYQQHGYQQAVSYHQPQQQYLVEGYSAGHQQYTPVDTPEVQHAKAAHFAAVARVQTQQNQHHEYNRYKRGLYYPTEYASYESQHYPQHYPKIINGVPEETPEVQLAKYQHLIAHQVAKARSHGDHDDATNYQAYNNEAAYAHTDGYYHIPVIGKDGVPIDTPEVRLARQQHLLAVHVAKSGYGTYASAYGGGYSDYIPKIGPNGVPYDTPEVQIARAKHLSAHAEESAKHNQWELHSGYGGGYSHY